MKEPKNDNKIRLNKFIANSGICSRRQADELIKNGEISVNGKVVTELGSKISPRDTVKHNGKKLKGEKNVYFVMNKPRNTVTTVTDPQGRRTVIDLLKNQVPERIYPVGRLDRQTTGVLLLTNDGDLTKILTHPSSNIPKVYLATLNKPFTKSDMQKIADGLELEDGFIKVDAISYTNAENKTEIGIEIHSGRNRIIRRIFESLEYEVIRLDRTYFAGLTKKNLKRGYWRELDEKELINFKKLKKKKK